MSVGRQLSVKLSVNPMSTQRQLSVDPTLSTQRHPNVKSLFGQYPLSVNLLHPSAHALLTWHAYFVHDPTSDCCDVPAALKDLEVPSRLCFVAHPPVRPAAIEAASATVELVQASVASFRPPTN